MVQRTTLSALQKPEYLQERAQDDALPLPSVQQDLQCAHGHGHGLQQRILETMDMGYLPGNDVVERGMEYEAS